MLSQRWRPLVYAGAAVLGIWIVATIGYTIAQNARMTAEKFKAYAVSLDLSKLSPEARAKALKELADKLNALQADERRRIRMERIPGQWFDQMTEEEKAKFIEETMPTGFKQMINAFEQMPEEKRRRAVEDSLRRLREAQAQAGVSPNNGGSTNTRALSEELQGKVRTIGLKTFYSQSSAQTKAELAPVLEELQRVMEAAAPSASDEHGHHTKLQGLHPG